MVIKCFSTLMNLKLKDMDEIIKMLHTSAKLQEDPVNRRTLLVVVIVVHWFLCFYIL